MIHQAGKHSPGVAVHGRNGNSEGNGGYGARGVRADARKGLEGLRVFGNPTAEALDHLARSVMEVRGPRVVPQALPELEYLLLVRLGEGRNTRKLLHPSLEVGDYGPSSRLLQHHFRYEDTIRVSVSPPRKIALPVPEEAAEGGPKAVNPGTGPKQVGISAGRSHTCNPVGLDHG